MTWAPHDQAEVVVNVTGEIEEDGWSVSLAAALVDDGAEHLAVDGTLTRVEVERVIEHEADEHVWTTYVVADPARGGDTCMPSHEIMVYHRAP